MKCEMCEHEAIHAYIMGRSGATGPTGTVIESKSKIHIVYRCDEHEMNFVPMIAKRITLDEALVAEVMTK